ncbi:MAG: UDP-N-acetylenolpyruvoylglucosamine reductase [Syntrophobacterales bacterium CG_4_8_14_3_um_filter_49_14]|nr:MAG: UDP-N-acetylenolpyruvoylglucosamine reductase [Syntrophobacterales bacterium CG23_combo_of_CG06-09_8_20_14_all_48_27]PJA47836.1 MAG: UDP-N-acetylenolpyruvoylglucosamine reductase [Syntrophobacterales bacterium CG_4_9_14_3_um_filter_49_8]PJC73144.1 MAG: UDP-N-acetylenolpyruvoylglucosamine reductase [Syntrophobacterales bacterium CG_4_8_14_3_um_filter_49_14]
MAVEKGIWMIRDALFREELKNMILGQVLFDEPTDRYTSIGVGGKADVMILPQATEELIRVVSYLQDHQVSFIAVGNWTNLIVKDGGYRGAIICLKGLHEISVEDKENDMVSVYAEAGVALGEIVNLSANEAFGGIEFCAGIPGSVGGGIRMNAGAYGSEIKDILEWVNLLERGGKILKVRRDDLDFAYRNLNLPEGSVITGASFLLRRGKREEIRERITETLGLRKKKHPLGYRSAGSIFKNPRGIPAGQLIDEIGLKGARIGDAKISEKHGNFIVNLGHAKAADVLALIEMVKERVLKEKGITLEVEVMIVGDNG